MYINQLLLEINFVGCYIYNLFCYDCSTYTFNKEKIFYSEEYWKNLKDSLLSDIIDLFATCL